MFKMLPLCANTSSRTLYPLACSSINYVLLQSTPDFTPELSLLFKFVDVIDASLVYTLLQDGPNMSFVIGLNLFIELLMML